jgi:beta-glucosidase
MPAAVRVKDLLSRMTLEEKAAQMIYVCQTKADTLVDGEGNFDIARAGAAFGHGHGIGQVGRPSDAGGGKDARATAELTNAIQRFFVENSRLGIPVGVSRGMPPRPSRVGQHQLSPADRSRQHV